MRKYREEMKTQGTALKGKPSTRKQVEKKREYWRRKEGAVTENDRPTKK